MKEYSDKFITGADELMNHIHGLCQRKSKICLATTKYLAQSIGKSHRQVCRYLAYLKETGQIEIETSKAYWDIENGFYKKRVIKSLHKVDPINSKEYLDVYFDKKLTEQQKVEETQKIRASAIPFTIKPGWNIAPITPYKETFAKDKPPMPVKPIKLKEPVQLRETPFEHDQAWFIDHHKDYINVFSKYDAYCQVQKQRKLQNITKNDLLKMLYLALCEDYRLQNLDNVVKWHLDEYKERVFLKSKHPKVTSHKIRVAQAKYRKINVNTPQFKEMIKSLKKQLEDIDFLKETPAPVQTLDLSNFKTQAQADKEFSEFVKSIDMEALQKEIDQLEAEIAIERADPNREKSEWELINDMKVQAKKDMDEYLEKERIKKAAKEEEDNIIYILGKPYDLRTF
jgi:hypothetical protein